MLLWNLQGDVMRIMDTSGTVVANYYYDAWGKVTNSGTIIGLYNPIRYCGYYYDTDTGFYYLQSRYYDPIVKRFSRSYWFDKRKVEVVRCSQTMA